MPVWRARPVVIEPVITVDSWQVIRLPHGASHIMGRHSNGIEVLISSRIVAIQLEPLRARTASGRIYLLSGPSGRSRGDDEVLRSWCDMNGVELDQTEFVGPGALDDLPRLV